MDGTETVAIMVAKKTSLSVGQIVLVCNIIIYLIAGILFGLDRALYSLLTYFITSRIVDYINTGLDQGKAVMIITDQGRVIAEDIYKTLGRTVTFLSGEGLLSGEKTVLYCVITRMELPLIRKIIEKMVIGIYDDFRCIGVHGLILKTQKAKFTPNYNKPWSGESSPLRF